MIITQNRKALYDWAQKVPKTPLQKSSNIKAVGYDPGSQTLIIEYHKGRSYAYQGVTPDMHSNIFASESPGKYLHENVIGKPQFRQQEITAP